MADQDSLQTKTPIGQSSNAEAKFIGRFSNINLDDEPDEAGNSLLLTRYPDKNDKNVEGIIRCLMEKKRYEENILKLELDQYIQLWKAIHREDWEEVKKELDRNSVAPTSPITEFHETILHVLVNWEKALPLLREIIETIDPDSLGKTDYQNDTALSTAAYVGKTEAAKMMARKKPELLTRLNYSGDSPFHAAARFGHEETFCCLLSVAQKTRMDCESFFSGKNGATMIHYLISANRYDLALDLLKSYPRPGGLTLSQRKRILNQLAGKPLGFESRNKFGLWERLIYKGISVTKQVTVPPVKIKCDEENQSNSSLPTNTVDRDEENPTDEDNFFAKCSRQAYSMIGLIVPSIEGIHKTKLMNEQARQLVKTMCTGKFWTFPDASDALKSPVLKAASSGIQEIVDEILKEYPPATMFYDEAIIIYFSLQFYTDEKRFSIWSPK